MTNDRKIKILPEFISNQIAAGEVVQRPESVIKELVENSLDANADTIAVIVKSGGKNLIHIVDNGDGMSREDLALSIKRHATSKIVEFEDLEQIYTYGFRGEALASISAVANLEIRTKRLNDELGWKLSGEPNKLEIIEPFNADKGTQIFVRNLFFNVPARRKFLKADLTEFRYISDMMLRFALSKLDVRLTFYDDDSLIFDLQPGNLAQRIDALFGSVTSQSLLPLKIENDFIKIDGFIGHPHLTKKSKSGQFLFLNERSIKSKFISHAIFSSYEHLLEKGSNPFYVLNITLNPKYFDVNVHPQKNEVKFEDEKLVYNMFHKAVTETLTSNNLAPEISFKEFQSMSPFEKVNVNNEFGNHSMFVNKETGEIVNSIPKIEPQNFSSNFNSGYPNTYRDRFSQPTQQFDQKKVSAYDMIFGRSTNSETNHNIEHEDFSTAKIPFNQIWQMHYKYIFVQTAEGVKIIDQHAAHERILYEKASKAMNKQFSNCQSLLFPGIIKFTASEYAIYQEIKEDLINLGYDLTEKADQEVQISGVPLDIKTGLENQSLREIIEQFDEYQKVRETTRRDNLAASYSCRNAIKTGHKLTYDEMVQLVDDLYKCEIPYACPHGRPIILEMSIMELDKKFGRIL